MCVIFLKKGFPHILPSTCRERSIFKDEYVPEVYVHVVDGRKESVPVCLGQPEGCQFKNRKNPNGSFGPLQARALSVIQKKNT